MRKHNTDIHHTHVKDISACHINSLIFIKALYSNFLKIIYF